MSRILFLLPGIFLFLITPSHAAGKCDALQKKFEQETPGLDFDYRSWIAAFEDLRHGLMQAAKEKGRQTQDYSQMMKTSKDLDCLDSEIHLKSAQPSYDLEMKMKQAGCRNDSYGRWKIESNTNNIRETERQSKRNCNGADPVHVAELWKQLEEVRSDKASHEQRETPAVKRIDASQQDGEFCQKIRSVSTAAANLFKSIAGKKIEEDFIQKDKEFGLPQIKMVDLTQIQPYEVAVSVTQPFMSVQPRCEIWVSIQKPILGRIEPNFYCRWQYEKIRRKELEEKADQLFNIVRGCYGRIAEENSEQSRHAFVGDDTVKVDGQVYFGDGKPSSIYLHLKKYTPEEDNACARYLLNEQKSNYATCIKKFW
jgi:hypothetical protein